MRKESEFSRRSFLAATGGLAFASRLPAATNEDKQNLAIIPRRVEKLFKTASIKEPNDLQFAPDGNLWILDQVDPNKVFKVNPKDGSIIDQVQTESIHGSGITFGNGAWWIGSTKALKTGIRPVWQTDDAVRRAWSEVGEWPVLDGRSCFRKDLPDGA
jgi:hypothetical protein